MRKQKFPIISILYFYYKNKKPNSRYFSTVLWHEVLQKWAHRHPVWTSLCRFRLERDKVSPNVDSVTSTIPGSFCRIISFFPVMSLSLSSKRSLPSYLICGPLVLHIHRSRAPHHAAHFVSYILEGFSSWSYTMPSYCALPLQAQFPLRLSCRFFMSISFFFTWLLMSKKLCLLASFWRCLVFSSEVCLFSAKCLFSSFVIFVSFFLYSSCSVGRLSQIVLLLALFTVHVSLPMWHGKVRT